MLLLTLCAAGAAPANVFTPPVNPFKRAQLLTPRDHRDRLSVGASLAHWDFPSFAAAGTMVERDAGLSPLLTARYAVS